MRLWGSSDATRAARKFMMGLVLVASLLAVVAAVLVPGQTDWLLLALPCALASLFVLLRRPAPAPQAGARVIIDGSNVMHWADGRPALDPVLAVVAEVTRQGLTPGVIFDANVGYKLGDRYQDDAELARKLGLPAAQVLVVPKGTQADDYILRAARDLNARVVTNDRYRDWKETYPDVVSDQVLLRGSYREGRLHLGDARARPAD